MFTEELTVTVARILARRRKADDPDLELASDDPRELRAYLRKHSRVPEWVQRADVLDTLTIDNWIWWHDRADLLADLERGKRAGLTLQQLGEPLGIRTAQGTNDLIDRYTALRDHHRPDEKLTRAARQAAQAIPGKPVRVDWVTVHHTALVEVVGAILAEADRWQVTDRDWLDDLATDLADDANWSLGVLNLACAELRTAPTVVALTTWHRVHGVLNRADQLRTSWAKPPAP